MPTVTILRRDKGKKESYEQTFSFEDKFRCSVVDLLHALNARETLEDASGAPAKRICFECSCETGSCGACAMLVNGTPMLACDAHLPDALRDGMLHLAPLTAFPCVCDLQVDRNVLRERARDAGLWLAGTPHSAEDAFFSECLHCGLCAEACEKYRSGRFDAPCAYTDADLLCGLEDADSARRKALKKSLKKALLCPCKTGECEDVCPRRLPLRQAIKRVGGSLFPF